MYLLIILINLCYVLKAISSFSPTKSDYDAYGLKIAVNDVLFVEVNNNAATFLVQFAPYNYTMEPLQCTINFDDSTHYVYSVGVGSNSSTTAHPYFYFTGEVVPSGFSTTDNAGHNGTFIGVWMNQDPQSIQQYTSRRQPLSCNYFAVGNLAFISSYGHQDFFVMAVEPNGQYAIGLAPQFGFIYRPFSGTTLTTEQSGVIWPNNTAFYPCAADASTTFTIVAGYAASSARSRVRATPTVYLIWNSNLTVLSTWSYSATNNSWQSRLTYSSSNTWSSQHTMSVKINSNDPTRVLVGMPYINTVFLFVIGNSGTSLTLASSLGNGNSVGFGKSVTWLTKAQAAILVTTYSANYLTYYSSAVYLYTNLSNSNIPAKPSAIFPNSQQPIPPTINSNLIRMVSSPSSIAALDTNGGVVIVLSEAAGSYASTDTTYSPIAAAMPVISYSATCKGGTYKSDAGVHPCTLCPNGSQNSGVSQISDGPPNSGGSSNSSGSQSSGSTTGTACTPCSSDGFCPLGAVLEINMSLLTAVSQAYAYPRPPDLNVYEDILLHNMFSIGATAHCVSVSPIFWILMLMVVFLVFFMGVGFLRLCVTSHKHDRFFLTVKMIFERTDLVGEGELWIGGVASIAIILVTAMAYAFAILYLNQYPSETVGPSNFACDTTIRNANFETNLQALAVPIPSNQQIIFDLLNEQNFTLYLQFINTAATCAGLTISQVTDSATISLSLLSCSLVNGTLLARVLLPEHDLQITATLSEVQVVGGIMLGLDGPSAETEFCLLKELKFRQPFYSPSGETLAQAVTITMGLTKAINETEPLSGSDSFFEGIWYPTFKYSLSQMFLSADTYKMAAKLTSTTLTINIAETPYYIKNYQAPIAKQAEVIFRTLLFASLCLEICATTFIICKLLLIPIYKRISAHLCPTFTNIVEPEYEMKLAHH
ncbi:unnamed protein product [Rotaria magnacalcarata]|uniref:Transmembrane protein n=7 Tax=Rotaria magnacalcarata TaxID=392030 RepID=A0A819DKG0_9BILA|nr:unnamed protein product [Rotaria magnacalcarata]CAF3829557.1 unnamed protein product [Rotaria magnacalcarata]